MRGPCDARRKRRRCRDAKVHARRSRDDFELREAAAATTEPLGGEGEDGAYSRRARPPAREGGGVGGGGHARGGRPRGVAGESLYVYVGRLCCVRTMHSLPAPWWIFRARNLGEFWGEILGGGVLAILYGEWEFCFCGIMVFAFCFAFFGANDALLRGLG